MKNLPIGVEDYLNAQRLFYVDKTLLIRDVIDFGMYKSLLFTRPRRFGKSLNLSMLEYYFTNSGEYGYAFEGKKISGAGEKYREHLNRYPVIRINLKDVYSPTFAGMSLLIKQIISEQYIRFNVLESSDKLTEYEKDEYRKVASMAVEDVDYYVTSIQRLSSCLFKHFGERVVILIDEYDAPIEQAFEFGYYEEALLFFKRFYSHSIKGNGNALLSVITGVLEVSKESLYSGFNNPVVASVYSDDFTEYFGFTADEVRMLLDSFGVDADIGEIRRYYGGYGNGKVEVFNPWSVLNYINEETYKAYWTNTGTTSLLSKVINNIGLGGEESFAEYINSDSPVALDPSINFQDLDDLNAVYSYLVQLGYLVARRESFDRYRIRIPNAEIRSIFEKEIIGRNARRGPMPAAQRLREALESADVDGISEVLETYILDSYSYYDLRDEKDYQNIITGILSVVFDDYVTKSEVNSKSGRCDIMISPKRRNDLGIVLEIKRYGNSISRKRLEGYAAAALGQIKGNAYYSELIRRDCDRILLYGFAFDANKVAVQSEEVGKRG